MSAGARNAGLELVRRVHIDTDPGLDDLLAIAVALACPELRVEGFTSVAGNATLDAVTDNLRRFLGLIGAELPLGRGAEGPLELSRRDAVHVHGEDGRAGVEMPEAPDGPAILSARAVLRRSLAERGVERIVALGPLTNLAALLREEPGLFAGVEVVWMGGALGRGNATPLAEFNAFADPRAAAELIASEVPLSIVGLDVTDEVAVRPADLSGAQPGSGPAGRVLARVLRALMEVERPTRGERAAVLHDPCAVLACACEGLFRWEEKHLEVRVEEGRERGRLIEAPGCGARPVRYAVEARGPEIVRLFLTRLASWA